MDWEGHRGSGHPEAGNAETARRARDQCVDLSKLKYAFCEDLRNKQLELSS